MEITRLHNESDKYKAMRQELLEAELELMQQRERVAELRRRLPVETVVDDYVFIESDGHQDREVRLSELFSGPDRTLVIYHFMFGKAQTEACPMCTMWIDGFDAVAEHVAQRIDLAVVAATQIEELRAFARSRGWDNLRLLSAAENSFKYDFASEGADGGQDSTISVFRLGDDGRVRHFYTGHPQLSDEHWRGVDLLTPVWHLFDLTPEGRGEWFPSLSYG
jgi:predicted dithiol-disulfide oxidoreductase (DUF899 family)